MNASKVSALPQVRLALIDLQHSFRQLPGLVADGRDMGTVIFPLGGVTLGVIFLHETLTWEIVVGAVLILASLVVANWSSKES